MNKMFLYKNGYITVSDENGVSSEPIKYENNTLEKLRLENKMEEVNNKIKVLSSEKFDVSKDLINNKSVKPLIFGLLAPVGVVGLSLLLASIERDFKVDLTDLINSSYVNIDHHFINSYVLIAAFSAAISIPTSAICCLYNLADKITDKEKLACIKDKITEQKIKYASLENDYFNLDNSLCNHVYKDYDLVDVDTGRTRNLKNWR